MANLENYYEILKGYGFKMENGSITLGEYSIEPKQNGLISIYHSERGLVQYASNLEALLYYFKLKK